MGKAPRQLAQRTVAALDAMSELWAAVDEYQGTILSQRPPNSITLAEYMERQGIGPKTAADQLKKLVGNGVLVKDRCKVFSGGALRVTNVYTRKA